MSRDELMNSGVTVPQPFLTLWGSGVSLACGMDGRIVAEELHGLFAGDTRVLSTYHISVSGHPWRFIGRSQAGHSTATWEYQNPQLRDVAGDIQAGTLLLRLQRRVDGALHDDLHIHTFTGRQVHIQLTLQMDADFADIFEVQRQSLPPRLGVRRVSHRDGVSLVYTREGFRRGLHVSLKASHARPIFVGSRIVFDLNLAPCSTWTCCLEAAPEVASKTFAFSGDPHEPEGSSIPASQQLSLCTDPILEKPFTRGRADLHALAMSQDEHPPYVAGGVPWFLTLFGRDSLVAAIMSGLDGAWSAEGALAALAPLQATAQDDWRDAEPGKLPHEVRQGELARRNDIPFMPAYYGTHDAPTLYCLALWNTWRWTGNRTLLEAHLKTAQAAMHWCDEFGDRDGDGFLEYGTRSTQGYYNQSWKDAGDAVVHADGQQATLPLATIEMQGYLFAARLAMAELLTEQGDHREAARLREAAHALRVLVEEKFWLAEQQFYAFALDGQKRQVAAISSNPGHLLWCGLADPQRAATIATRFFQPDLFSGWGLRTLSSQNPAYNPLSYQRGSVWPHDTVLAAAGLWRYGLYAEASRLILSILQAAAAFSHARLPELFCGLDRSHDLPVPYEKANSPQAWAAASSILVAQLLLGLVPDASRKRCFVSPWLPEWLPRLELRGIVIGEGSLDITVVRRGTETVVEQVDGKNLEVTQGKVAVPLWGTPPDILKGG